MTAEWDFQKGSVLKDFLFPGDSVSRLGEIDQISKCRKLHETESPMVSSSQESDFNGFTPNSIPATDAKQIEINDPDRCIETIEEKPHLSGSSVQKAIGSTGCGSAQTITSEEFSDQDVRYRLDMDREKQRLCEQVEDNTSQCNVSDFTIEPTSSDDEDDLANRSTILNMHESSTNLHTLSINENSNNAVDNTILDTTLMPIMEFTDLSFNGKLKGESIIKITSTSIDQSNKLDEIEERKKDLNITNVSDKSNLEWQLQQETNREHINERSPDLFSDDDDDLDNDNNELSNADAVDAIDVTINANDVSDTVDMKNEENDNNIDKCIEKTEKMLSKRIQAALSGIVPPPSVTFIQHDITNLLTMYKRNVALVESFIDDNNHDTDQTFMPKLLDNVEWPQLKRVNAYGVHYNRTKYTDNIEMMFMKLVERNVGSETGSSFSYSNAPSAKKKPIRKLYVNYFKSIRYFQMFNIKLNDWNFFHTFFRMSSPGNRLSHLARRRAIFSSANLQSQSQFSNLSKLGQKTCVIDAS